MLCILVSCAAGAKLGALPTVAALSPAISAGDLSHAGEATAPGSGVRS